MSVSFSPPEPISARSWSSQFASVALTIDELARRIDREEAARRVVEIFDRVLQFLEHVFLALAIAA